MPRGYDKEHPQAEYLKYKSWYLEYPISDDMFRDGEGFLNLASSVFQRMKPFHGYLNIFNLVNGRGITPCHP